MAWFKVDDSFYDHPKFLDVPNAAVGLWAKSGAWCGKHLTDGVIPATQVRRFKGTKSQIDALLSVRIWVQCEDESGAKAYRFHDWNDYNPDRKAVLKERQDGAERQRKARERKRQEQEERKNVTRDSRVTPSRESRVSHNPLSHRPDPARPDPARPLKEEEVVNVREVGGDQPTSPPFFDSNSGDEGVPSDWSQASDPRCRKHAKTPADQVPPCRACGQARAWFQEQAEAERDEARRVIDACSFCDDRGLASTTDTNGDTIVVRCDHLEPPRPVEAEPMERPTVAVPDWKTRITQARKETP